MCDYPSRILPNRQYVRRINIDELHVKCQNSLLIRRLDSDEYPFHEIGGRKLLNEGVINDDVLDWSTNLLGGEFKIEDICWRQTLKGVAEWNGEEVDIHNYDGNYHQIVPTYYIFIKINCLHKATIPYNRKFGSKKELEQYAKKTNDVTKDNIDWYVDNEVECHATITIEHKPTMLNYWHMTIEITPRDFDKPMPRNGKQNKSLKKKVREALHVYLVSNVMCEVESVENIPKELYLNNI